MDYKAKLLQTLPTMDGWCDPAKANHAFDMVVAKDPSLIVEIGVFAGRSLIAFALGLEQVGREGTVVYGVDPWAASDAICNNEGEAVTTEWWNNVDYNRMKLQCQSVVNQLGVTDRVRLVQKSSVEAYADIPGEINMLHIDGNHSQWDSCRDVTVWVDRVKTGGIIYLDDEDWASTKNAQELLELKCKKLGVIKSTNECGFYEKLGPL